MIYEYPAILIPHEDGTGFLADVPDMNCCSSSGHTIDEAVDMITDALSLVLITLEDEGLEIPKASDFEQFKEYYGNEGIVIRIQTDLDEYRAMLEMYPPEVYEDDEE